MGQLRGNLAEGDCGSFQRCHKCFVEVTRLATHVSEQDLETTEGDGVDLLAQLLELVEWSQVNDQKTEKDLS